MVITKLLLYLTQVVVDSLFSVQKISEGNPGMRLEADLGLMIKISLSFTKHSAVNIVT